MSMHDLANLIIDKLLSLGSDYFILAISGVYTISVTHQIYVFEIRIKMSFLLKYLPAFILLTSPLDGTTYDF